MLLWHQSDNVDVFCEEPCLPLEAEAGHFNSQPCETRDESERCWGGT